MTYFTKRYHPPGTSPGTLRTTAETTTAATRHHLIHYTPETFTETVDASADECATSINIPGITWLHIHGNIDDAQLRIVAERFDLHALALEDVINTGQRPKIDEYGDHLFIVMALPVARNNHFATEQISVFWGRHFVLSIHPGSGDPFEPIRRRLRDGKGRIRNEASDYLVYALLDVIIDSAFPVLEHFGEKIEDIETEVLTHPTRKTLNDIHSVRRELLLLRRMLWPQREVVNFLMGSGNALVRREIEIYLRDCADHTIQIMELTESYRDMAASLLDVYLSSVSNRLNDIMRTLTVIATIFMPLTFIVGIYGMNFGSASNSPWAMPELRWDYGYPAVWLVMLVVAGGMLYYFKRKKWY